VTLLDMNCQLVMTFIRTNEEVVYY